MLKERFEESDNSLISRAQDCFAIVPGDGVELAQATKAIFISVSGDLALIPLRGGAAITFRNLPSGSILDVRARAVMATGTTATDLVGLS